MTIDKRAAALAESLRGMHTTSPTALKRIVAALDAAHAEALEEAAEQIKHDYSGDTWPAEAVDWLRARAEQITGRTTERLNMETEIRVTHPDGRVLTATPHPDDFDALVHFFQGAGITHAVETLCICRHDLPNPFDPTCPVHGPREP